MVELSEMRYRQLIDICIMHYEEGLTQQEIANRIGISRPQISRMLATAREAGIVKIVVENPFSEEYRAQKMLKDIYGLYDATIISAPDSESQLVQSQLALAVATHFESNLKEDSVLGILSGKTIYGISKVISLPPRKRLTVVSLSGGCERMGYQQANNSAHYFADKFNCRFCPLQAPLVVANQEVRSIITEEYDIAQTIKTGNSSTMALVGIGCLDSSSPYFGNEMLDLTRLKELKERGAVAGLSGSFLNINGELVDYPESNRVIAIPLENLKRIPKVIAVAYGQEKVEAIEAVLNGGWVDILITTLDTAKALIRQKQNCVDTH